MLDVDGYESYFVVPRIYLWYIAVERRTQTTRTTTTTNARSHGTVVTSRSHDMIATPHDSRLWARVMLRIGHTRGVRDITIL